MRVPGQLHGVRAVCREVPRRATDLSSFAEVSLDA